MNKPQQNITNGTWHVRYMCMPFSGHCACHVAKLGYTPLLLMISLNGIINPFGGNSWILSDCFIQSMFYDGFRDHDIVFGVEGPDGSMS